MTYHETACPTHGPMRVTDLRLHQNKVAASCKFCLTFGEFPVDQVRIVNGVVEPR